MTIDSSTGFDLDLSSISQVPISSNNILSPKDMDTIDSVLSKFDPQNLSTQDANSIVKSFEDAGIQPSRHLSDALDAYGFDAKEIGDLSQSSSSRDIFSNLSKEPAPAINKEEETSIFSKLEDVFSSETSQEDDSLKDYTSRIVNLNDSAKQSVMDIIDKYSQNDSNYSKNDLNKLLENSLDSILKDGNNYNRVALFA